MAMIFWSVYQPSLGFDPSYLVRRWFILTFSFRRGESSGVASAGISTIMEEEEEGFEKLLLVESSDLFLSLILALFL